MAMYVGINGSAKQVSELYVGVNGVPKEAKTVYCGNNNALKCVFEATAPPGETVFTSSGYFTVPKGITEIEAFVVGGGGGGSGQPSTGDGSKHYPDGGGSGYTNTQKISVNPGNSIQVTVGAGISWSFAFDGIGGSSSVESISAIGGYCPIMGYGYRHGNGGSGGGGGGLFATSSGFNYDACDGASDGNDSMCTNFWQRLVSFAIGQHTTTRAFGESNGTLYAGGGGGYKKSGGLGGGGNGAAEDIIAGDAGAANTGGGGGGGGLYNYNIVGGGAGGSGIAIIRWGH